MVFLPWVAPNNRCSCELVFFSYPSLFIPSPNARKYPPSEHDLGLRPEWHDHNHWEEISRVDQAGYSEGVHSRAPISDAFSPVV